MKVVTTAFVLVSVATTFTACKREASSTLLDAPAAKEMKGDCRTGSADCELQTVSSSESAEKIPHDSSVSGSGELVRLEGTGPDGLALNGAKVCVTGTGLARGEHWPSTIFTWNNQFHRVQNRISEIATVNFQLVQIETRCIANTQGGVTSCGMQTSIKNGNVAPEVDVQWWGYNGASDKSQLATDTAANNGVATVNFGFGKGAGVSLAGSPTIGFSYAGANVGITVSASVEYKREYTGSESCQAVDAR